MDYHRYGKFCFTDYLSNWIVSAVMIIMSIIGLMAEVPPLYISFFAVYAIIRVYFVFESNSENFCIEKSRIITKKGKRRNIITIPEDVVLIISYADIAPYFTRRSPTGNETYILKRKYAITIVKKMPLEVVLNRLHCNNFVKKYTMSMMKDIFTYNYVYSFVCDQNLFESIIKGRNCLVIVPQSLVEQIDIDESEVSKYIDIGY